MKKVQLSEKDRAILKGCAIGSSIGKSSIADLRALLKANEKLSIDSASNDIDQADGAVAEYLLEDAELAAIKTMYEEGRAGLRKTHVVVAAVVACIDHIEAAQDVTDKPAGA